MKLNEKIETALDAFWYAAYEQGRDQRDHDDEDGTAQKAEEELRNAISDALLAASTPTPSSHVWGEAKAEDCILNIGSQRVCAHGTLGCVNHHAPAPVQHVTEDA